MNPREDEDMTIYKLIVVGQSGVGKSNLISRYTQDKFFIELNTTIGVEFISKVITYNEERVNLQIWDTAGQQRYRSVNKVFYKNAIGALVVFSLADRSSFQKLRDWIKEIRDQIQQSAVLVLVGNKSDLKDRQVTVAEAVKLAKEQDMAYIETSALLNLNITKAYDMLISAIFQVQKENQSSLIAKKPKQSILLGTRMDKSVQNTQKSKRQKCC